MKVKVEEKILRVGLFSIDGVRFTLGVCPEPFIGQEGQEVEIESLSPETSSIITKAHKMALGAIARKAQKGADEATQAAEAKKFAVIREFPGVFQRSSKGQGFVMFCGKGLTAFSNTDAPQSMRGTLRGTGFQFSQSGPHVLCGKESRSSGRFTSEEGIARANAKGQVLAVGSTKSAIFWVEKI